MTDQFTARRVIEGLRAGVPSLTAASLLGIQHVKLLDAFNESRQTTGKTNAGGSFLIAGNFGSGKSHALRYLQGLAAESGHAHSLISISKETPCGDLGAMYRAAISSIHLGDRAIGGSLAELFEGMNPNGPAFSRLCSVVSEGSSSLNPVFLASLLLYKRYAADLEIFEELRSFWDGGPPQIASWKKHLRGEGLALRAARSIDVDSQRFDFAGLCLNAAGYSGWFVALDEIELVAKFGLRARAKAYANLAYLFSTGLQHNAGSWFAVGAVTEDLASVLFDERNDENVIRERYASEPDLVSAAMRGTAILNDTKRTFRLGVPTAQDLQRIHDLARDLYSTAYNFGAQSALVPTGTRLSKSVRQYIREWIAHWDLKLEDASYEPSLSSRETSYSLGEDQDFESAAV